MHQLTNKQSILEMLPVAVGYINFALTLHRGYSFRGSGEHWVAAGKLQKKSKGIGKGKQFPRKKEI